MAEKIKLSSRVHPLYTDNLKKWDMYKDAAFGGDDFINEGYLETHRLEDIEDYEERLERAYYLNFCDTIPSLYNSYIFKENINRPSDEKLKFFREDVNGRNTTITYFIDRVSYLASIFGAMHVLVDTPSTKKKNVSKRDAKESKLRPYVSLVYPSQLRDWSVDNEGNFNWVIIEYTYYRDLEPTKKREVEKHYKLITKEEWRVEDADGKSITYEDGSEAKGVNTLGVVPLVTIYHKDIDDNRIGESMLKDIVYINKAIFNWSSCIDEQIERQTFAQLVIPDDGSLAEEDESGKDPLYKLSQTSAYTFSSEAKHPPQFISPDTQSIKSIWSLILDHVKEMYRMAGLQGGTSDLYTSRSGRQSQMSFIGVNSNLAKKSQSCEKFENDLSKLVYLFLSADPNNFKYVKYPTNFDVVALAEEIDANLKIMERNFSPTLNKEIMKDISRRAVPTATEEIRKTIENEIDTGDGIVEPIKANTIEPEKDGQGNTNNNSGDSFKTKEELEEEEVQKGKRK